ncbi:sensor histidine kinase [Patiriisocius hiemis]|uniref:histidine kinase n=1 Tax=Patiriisocius hiemis TaxID=3075604 RepID=A0ABU2YBG0_9FLAO|nr:HAMP domain-containing sensor histidine kinase [Constantimarinum sp. W242]MDT0555342.1 HAMP domain-containing sensor histidine kinase [Constantimarinum sp. W242]
MILLSVVTLVALIAIQGYLIYNTYQLKKKTYTIDARNAIAKVYNTPELDSIMWLYRTDFKDNLKSYEAGNLSKDSLLKKLQDKSTSINYGFMEIFNSKLAETTQDYKIQFKKIVNSINLSDSLQSKSLIYDISEKNDTILLVGERFSNSDAILINNSTWQDAITFEKTDDTEEKTLNFKSSIYMSISNWNNLLFREMSGLLILSSFLFLFVVSLLFYSIQNLFKQKRIAAIKTDFINNITHELKTPLTTLSLATKTLSNKVLANKTTSMVTDTIKVIERQNTRLQNLIDQVLKNSLGYNEIKLNKEEINASVFLNELLNDYELGLDKEIAIERAIDKTGVLMLADKFHISTAILNILNNAIKYGGTQLLVSYTIDHKSVCHLIKITDNGIGIEPKYQKFIFEKFYRAQGEKDTHNYKGLGLGLYYTAQIVKAHNSQITVESKKNKGTTFTINIPVAQ